MTHTVVRMQSEPATLPGLVSVLVPCCGQLEYTKLCVPSLLRHSTRPFELLFLDIGSLDGTADYLAGLAAAAPVRVEVVRTPTDLGLGTAVHEALERARGDYLVLLNNDTLVTENWLVLLTALANLAPQIGLVGPMSNCAAPPQLVEAVPYRLTPRRNTGEVRVEVGAVERFAHTWREEQRGKWAETDRLGGFCLLVKRAVLEAVGPLSPESGLGLFDTDALCAKARQAGFILAVCLDLFIHHFGSRTFAHGAPAATG